MNTMKNDGCFYDVLTNTVMMTKAFQKKASIVGSPEYEMLMKIRRDAKDVKMVVEDSRSKSSGKTARIKFSDMEAYIRMFPAERHEDLFKRYETVKKLSKTQRSPYLYVLNWFKYYFPNYGSDAEFNENGELTNLKTADDIKKEAFREGVEAPHGEVEALESEMEAQTKKIAENLHQQSEEEDDEKAS